ncbi:MAG TPA: DinB family protein, partial [Actinomycetota bacterium]|nr:DinB family protein [Actinomycetota bacterium]
MDRSYVEANARELERMRSLVARLGEEELRARVNPHWTVAGVLGHIAFWDGRTLALARKLERGEPFTPADVEPEDVDWINDATRPLIHAIPPGEAARLAVAIAEETDAAVASLPP